MGVVLASCTAGVGMAATEDPPDVVALKDERDKAVEDRDAAEDELAEVADDLERIIGERDEAEEAAADVGAAM